MKRARNLLVLSIVLTAYASAPRAGSTAPAGAAIADRELRGRVAKSLAYLERDGTAWMHGEHRLNPGNGCISCHVVGFTLWSRNAARRRGLDPFEGGGLRALTDEAMEFIARPGIGRAVTWSQMMLSRSIPADDELYDWRSVVDGIVASQESEGHWRARGQFPSQRRPEAESDAVATMWAVLALSSSGELRDYGGDARSEALSWLDGAEGVSSEWLAARLLIEELFGAEPAATARRDQLLTAQRADGGWSWLVADYRDSEAADDPSNPYSTGVALYALRKVGLEPDHPALRAAVGYLLETQSPDGIWSTPSELTSAEPSEEKDYIYEYWGTAWAVIGLAEMVASEQTASIANHR